MTGFVLTTAGIAMGVGAAQSSFALFASGFIVMAIAVIYLDE